MTTESSKMLLDFATKAPESFAATLDKASLSDIIAILNTFPSAPRAAVLANLSAELIDALYLDQSFEFLPCIEKGALEDAKTILIRLSRSKRLKQVDMLSAGVRRRTLKRFLNYPEHSLGSYVSNDVIIVTENASLASVLATIKKNRPACPVIIQTTAGYYAGILDARRVLEGDSKANIGEFANPVKALQAETSIQEAVDADQWLNNILLPVVDHESHVLGVVSRERILNRMAHFSPPVERVQHTLESMIGTYFKVMSGLMQSLLNSKSSES